MGGGGRRGHGGLERGNGEVWLSFGLWWIGDVFYFLCS